MVEVTLSEAREMAKTSIAEGYKGNAIVAFVDILGFSDEIKTKWNNSENDPLVRILALKDFLAYVKSEAEIFKLTDNDETTIVASAPYPDVITLSDSFVFIQKIEENDDASLISALLSISFNILELWRISIDSGFTLRGGVDYGGLFYSLKEIIGPSYIEAYRLESKVADISRIVFSHRIKELVYDKHTNIPSIIQEYLQRYFRIDIDSYMMLNPVMLSPPNDYVRNCNFIYKLKAMRNGANIHCARNKYDDLINRLVQNDRSKISFNDFK